MVNLRSSDDLKQGEGIQRQDDLKASRTSYTFKGRDRSRMALDLGLPGIDPVVWLETLAAESPRLASRTVVITGRDLHREERIRIEACGASILLKPFRIGPLLDRLLHDRERPLRPVTGESWPAVREPPPGSDPDR